MEWTSSEVSFLARVNCAVCHGEGEKGDKNGEIVPCNCVLRRIFCSCYARFRVCIERQRAISRVSFEHFGGRDRRMMWVRKDEEFAADFCLVSKRVLDPFCYQIFSYHFLLGADWGLCCRRLKIDRGRFFHAVYAIEETLGRVFHDLEPYPLYPVRDYFSVRVRGCARPGRLRTTLPSGFPASGTPSEAGLRHPLPVDIFGPPRPRESCV